MEHLTKQATWYAINKFIKFKRTEITQSMFLNHSENKLETNNWKIYGKSLNNYKKKFKKYIFLNTLSSKQKEN